MSSGIATIKVIEGYVNDVIIEGETLSYTEYFEYFKNKIKDSKPFNNKILEQYTLLASQLYGLDVKSLIRPSKNVQGASDIVFITKRKYFDGFISFDNRGNKSTGKETLSTNLSILSPFDMKDRYSFGFNTAFKNTNRLKAYNIGYDYILTPEGLNLSLGYSYSNSNPGGDLRNLDLISNNDTYTIQLTQPYIKTRAENLNVWLGFNHQHSTAEMLKTDTQNDKVRKLRVGSQYDFVDKYNATNMFIFELHQGLNIDNATCKGDNLASRADGHCDFTKLTLDITRTQYFQNNLSLNLGLSGQATNKALLSSEEFGFGGGNYGRAYNSSEITGDNGVAFKTELGYMLPVNIKNINMIQPYIFHDIGKVYDKDGENFSAASAGIGVRTSITEYMSGQIEWTKPLTRDVNENLPNNGRDSRIFFNLSFRM